MPGHTTALVRVGRPAVVVQDGWRVYVGVHDAWHCEERARLEAGVYAAHPDRGRRLRGPRPGDSRERRYAAKGRPWSGWSFRRRKAALRQWLETERAWYAAVGLDLPA